MSTDQPQNEQTWRLSQHQRIHQVCEAFIESWKTFLREKGAARPDIGEHLKAFEGHERELLFHELLDADLHFRRNNQESPTPDEYADRFPELETNIKSWFKNADKAVENQSNLSTYSERANAGQEDSQPDATPRSEERDPDIPWNERYEILGEIAHGAMGLVYRARHRTLGRRVAVKVLMPGALRDRFLREARLLASINSPHVVQVYDSSTKSVQSSGIPTAA